jgi:TatD DNase family protein
MFDSHCHLDASAYEGRIDGVLARARQAQVTGIFLPACEPAHWNRIASLGTSDPLLCFGLGIHPWYVERYDETELVSACADLRSARERGACAIGECGLDALRAKRGGAPLELQRKVLEAQLTIARERSLPIVLHCVRAHGALLEILEREGTLPAGGVMHSYSGSLELLPRYEKLGLSFSFAGVVTRTQASKARAVARQVPLARLMVESDGPDQVAVQVSRGHSEPCDIRLVLSELTQLRDESFETLASRTATNAAQLFSRA